MNTDTPAYFDGSWATLEMLEDETGLCKATLRRRYDDLTVRKDVGKKGRGRKPYIIRRDVHLFAVLQELDSVPEMSAPRALPSDRVRAALADADAVVSDAGASFDPLDPRLWEGMDPREKFPLGLRGADFDFDPEEPLGLQDGDYDPSSPEMITEMQYVAAVLEELPDEIPERGVILNRHKLTSVIQLHHGNVRLGSVEGENYLYAKDDDIYLFPDEATIGKDTLCLSGDTVRQMRRDYTNWDGEWDSINDLAYQYEWPRPLTVRLLRRLGVTHDALPRTDEEFRELLTDDDGNKLPDDEARALVDNLVDEDLRLASLRHKYLDDFQRAKYKELQRKAEAWDLRAHNQREEQERLAELLGDYNPPTPYELEHDGTLDDGFVVFNLQDLHAYKSSYLGFETPAQNNERILNLVRKGVMKARRQGNVTKAFLTVGGDQANVDNGFGQTYKGTPQRSMMSPGAMQAESKFLAVQIVNELRALGCEVELVYVRGNHDPLIGQAIYEFLFAYFWDDEAVRAETDHDKYRHPRQYRKHGRHLLIFLHGDMRKKQFDQLDKLSMQEARFLVGTTDTTTVFTGHLHFQVDRIDVTGTAYHQAASPSADDEWHLVQGYVGSRKGITVTLMETWGLSDHPFFVAEDRPVPAYVERTVPTIHIH